jgi:hypothetical protein
MSVSDLNVTVVLNKDRILQNLAECYNPIHRMVVDTIFLFSGPREYCKCNHSCETKSMEVNEIMIIIQTKMLGIYNSNFSSKTPISKNCTCVLR